jgi:hypothetical protein
VFTIDGTPIENVEEFLYLGRILQNKDDDGPTVRRNLRRARNRWAQLRHLLTREGPTRELWRASTKPSSKQCYCMDQNRGYYQNDIGRI